MTVIRSVTTYVSNAIFFLSDVSLPENPLPSVERLEVASNGKCILIPCQHEDDGPTEIILGAHDDIPKDGFLVFSGMIHTPNLHVVCSNVTLTTLLEAFVPSRETRVTIWTDGNITPARVVIGLE